MIPGMMYITRIWQREPSALSARPAARGHFFYVVLRLLFVLVYLGAITPPLAEAAPARKAVLVLFPYQSDLPNHEMCLRAIQEEFDKVGDLEVDMYYEYLELNRFPDPIYQAQMFALLAAKYHDTPIDLVILQTEVLLKLWLVQRREILPDTPVVFYSTNTASIAALPLSPDVVGVSDSVDFTPSIEWILRTRQSVNEIVLVYGPGPLEREYIQPVEQLQIALGEQARLTDLSGLPLDQIMQRAATLPRTSVILYTLMFEDAAGIQHRPIDVVQELAAVSPVPVISGYDQYLGSGTIGGYMFSSEQQARDAVQIGLRILRGEDVSAIPIQRDQSNRFIFDHLALQRYGIPLSVLPEGSIIKNRQYTLWEQYRSQLVGLGIGVAGLLLLVVYLGSLTRRLSSTRQSLSQLNANLEIQVQERTASLSETNRLLEAEMIERQRAEEIVRLRLRLFEFAAAHSLEALMQYALDEIGQFTDSPIGFYHFVEADQKTLSLRAWSTRTLQEFCTAEGQGMHYSLDAAGVWADCARQRQPVIHNDYATLPASHRKGLPPGHAEVRRELVVPTMRGGQIVAILGVGNKPADYDERDVEMVAYVADIIWNIVESKRAEEALRQYAEQLEAQNAELDTFAHTVAHDLKNPIGLVIGYAEISLMDPHTMPSKDIFEYLTHILHAGQKLNVIVEELMLLAGVRKQAVEPERLDMDNIVQEALERVQMLIQDRQAHITLLDAAGWPAALGYAPWIEEVWANYISNAVKYGGNPPHITIGADPPLSASPLKGEAREMARFWVRDDGPGLSVEMQQALFTPFTQLNQAQGKGHGLGLSIVRRIVEKLGGEVGVESKIGQGSTFFFTLPSELTPENWTG